MYLFIHIACNICQATICPRNVKLRMRYDSEKNTTHGCKLHVGWKPNYLSCII